MSDTGFPRFTSVLGSNIVGKASPLPEGQAHILSLPEGVRADVVTLRESLHLQGEIIQENRDHSVRVRTERGDIDVRAQDRKSALRRGAQVELEIQPPKHGRATPEVALVTVREPAPRHRLDNTPIEIEVRGQAAVPTSHAPTERPSLATQIQALPPEGSVVRLTPLLSSDVPPSPPPVSLNHFLSSPSYLSEFIPQNTTAPPTSSLQVSLPHSLETPAFDSTLKASSSHTAGLLEFPATPSATVAPIVESPQSSALLFAQSDKASVQVNNLDVHIDRILPPALSLQPPPPDKNSLILQNGQASNLTGIVTGITTEQLPLVSLFFPHSGESILFALQSPADQITVGTQIQITPQTASTQTLQSGAQAPTTLPLSVQIAAQPWPLMEELQQHLARNAPQMAQAMGNVTASPAHPASFGPAALFFIAALRGGDLTQWLGDKALDALSSKDGGKNILSRLTQEGTPLSRAASESTSQDWRIANFPLAWEGQIQKVALYYKHEHSEDEDGSSDSTGTRFVFDLALNRMGKTQIDGLFCPISENGKRLNLMIRTQKGFSGETQAEMRRVYAAALRHSDVTGELSFQNAEQGTSQWVSVQIDPKERFGASA